LSREGEGDLSSLEKISYPCLTHLDLFSGIGGFALAARWVGGFDTIAFCDNEEFTWKILAKNFPGIPIFKDVRKLHPVDLIPREGRIDLITAGFPCQDLSDAGARRGIEADRSGLFFEIVRIVDEVYAYCGARPILVLENVPGLLSGDGGAWARRVYGELAGRGYHCEWKVVSAADVGAPHLRRRWWCVCYVADTEGNGNRKSDRTSDTGRKNVSRRENPLGIKLNRLSKAMADTNCSRKTPSWNDWRMGRVRKPIEDSGNHDFERWLTEPDVGRVAHGIPNRVDRLKGLGNAVVPRCAMIPLLRAKEILTGEHFNEKGHSDPE